MMQFHLEGFIFFQNTSQKTISHLSQPKCALWKVSVRQAWWAVTAGAGKLGQLLQPHWSGIPRELMPLQEVVILLVPLCHGWAVPQHHCCDRTVSVCGGSSSQAGSCSGADNEFLLPAFTQLWAESWWWCCEEEESSHLLCNSPSSPVCIADILRHRQWCWCAFSRSPAWFGPVWFEWWHSQSVLRLCEDKCGTGASNTVCLYSVSSWHSAF